MNNNILLDLTCFLLLPCLLAVSPVKAQEVSEQAFGMHGHRLSESTPWPSVPFGSWRLWDTRTNWREIEPQKGKWNFALLDKDVALAESHHVTLLYTFGHIPEWTAIHHQTDKEASEPKSLDDWREFVETVAKRYKGRIAAYELWNEPNLKQFYGGDVDHLLAMASTAYHAIKSADSSAIVVSPSPSRDTEYLDRYLRAGGGKYADVIGFHMYVYPKPPEAIGDTARAVRAVMKDNGQSNKPLWDTETGWATPKPFPQELDPAYVARSYLVALSSGIDRLYWYSWDNHGWVSLQMTEADDKTLTPAGQAYGEIQKWLVGAKINSCNPDANGTWMCDVNRNGAAQKILWREKGSLGFKVPSSWHVSQIHHLDGSRVRLSTSTIEVTPEPILLTN